MLNISKKYFGFFMVPPSKKKWERFLDFLVMFPFFCKKKKKYNKKITNNFIF